MPAQLRWRKGRDTGAMSAAFLILYGIPNCDTVKRARAWLQARGVACRFHDFKREGLPPGQPEGWLSALGHERLINRQGTTWRKLDEAVRSAVVDGPSAATLITDQPSLIRRPLVQWPDGAMTVGFDEADWISRLGG